MFRIIYINEPAFIKANFDYIEENILYYNKQRC